MKPVDQTQFAGQGAGGDCVRASLASILELSIAEVPHFLEIAAQPSHWEIEFVEWLEALGIGVWREEGHYVFDGFYLASGPAERGVSHMVVYRNGELAHDPHPSRAGLIDVAWSRMLVPLDPAILLRA
jgi:hypothetical protein